MPTSSPQSQRLGDYTSIAFEICVAALTALPFFVLAYFYPALPDRVPLFMKLNGDVAVWGEKSWLSVFRVPLMAVVTQVVSTRAASRIRMRRLGIVTSVASTGTTGINARRTKDARRGRS